MGSTADKRGVNFALFSAYALKVELCLFDTSGAREIARLCLPERTGDIWHGYLPGAGPGLLYGYRVHGRYEPHQGHRFNPNKLLIDPYARSLDRSFRWDNSHCGYKVGDGDQDFSFDTVDNGPIAQKCRVTSPRPSARATSGSRNSPSLIYELHVRGQTILHPEIPAPLRGTIAGLCHPIMLDYLVSLGVDAVELMPVHPAITSKRLAENGLVDYWGYNSINFFALEPRYLSTGQPDEFRAMVRAFHDTGIAVILDVVFNHSGEGDHLGPTLSFRGIDNASYYCLGQDKSRYIDITGCKNTLNFAQGPVQDLVIDSLRYWASDMEVDGFRFDLGVTLAREAEGFRADAGILRRIGDDPLLRQVSLIAEPWDLGPDGYRLGEFPAPWLEWNDRYRDDVRRYWRGDGNLRDFSARLLGSTDLFGATRDMASLNYVTAHDGYTLQDLVSYAQKHNAENGEDNADGPAQNFSDNHGVEGPADDPAIRNARNRQRRNFLATLLLSHGIPMLTAGDEFGRSQGGNNNPYCQDNHVSWLDWVAAGNDRSFTNFVSQLSRLRKSHMLPGPDPMDSAGHAVRWLSVDGRQIELWTSPQDGTGCFGAHYKGGKLQSREECLLIVNSGPSATPFALPSGGAWRRLLDTTRDEQITQLVQGNVVEISGNALMLLVRPLS
ncbi:MAG: glycogen debranching protein GlgX [Alphaproteobacteria bacterium]|nr:glycogen debranching protein GlgX [Alphaproteobacteria bacterium]